MSKKSATKDELGGLHNALTKVFNRVLDQYNAGMDRLDGILTQEQVEDEIEQAMLAELNLASLQPSPAMLGAISKFLKDNEIRFNDEDVDKLGTVARSLEERRKNRSNVVELRSLRAVGDD